MKDFEQQGLVDDTANLEGARVYVLTGTQDRRVVPRVNRRTVEFYEKLGANVEAKFDLYAGHLMPTYDYGIPCYDSDSPFIGDCSFSGAEESLKHLHPGRVSTSIGRSKPTNIFPIRQRTDETVMGPAAYAYIPDGCQSRDAN